MNDSPFKGPEDFVFHSLRHSFNTGLRNQGIPDFLIQAYTGHSSPVMTDNYTDVMMASFDGVVKIQDKTCKKEGSRG